MRQGLIVDLFAGGGGASVGIEQAFGRPVDVAINHSAQALAVHEANHPETRHLRGDIWSYAPSDVTGGAPVDFLWASPSCVHFSQAKGGPLDRKTALKVRSLAWVLRRWGADRRSAPMVWAVENVKQFEDWGPLDKDGKPIQAKKGHTFKRWVRELERLGYNIEWRTLAACDYGTPTTRERIFVIGRRDGEPIVWPEPTHGPGLLPYLGADQCIDWSIPVPSIFGRQKPLVDNTLRRIVRGMDKFVLGTDDPYFVGDQLAAHLIPRGFGERKTQAPRCMDIREPLRTVVAGGTKHCLVVAFVAKHFGGNETPGQSLTQPFGTVTCKDHHALIVVSGFGDRREEVRALMDRFSSVREPSLFSPKLDILDIGMRWFTPRELARAQGFPDSYQFDVPFDGKLLKPTKQVLLVGNSVAPPMARAIVEANIGRRVSVAA